MNIKKAGNFLPAFFMLRYTSYGLFLLYIR